MITRSQQRKHSGANRRHAGTETDTGDPLLHRCNFIFQRGHCGINLAPIGISRLLALKYRRQFMSIFETECHGIVHRFMHRTMLYSLLPIAVYYFAGKSFHYWPVRYVTEDPLS